MNGFKFIRTLKITFCKHYIDPETKKPAFIYETSYFNGKTKTLTNLDDIEYGINESDHRIMYFVNQWVSEGSGWTIDRLVGDFLNITLYNPLSGSSYVKLPAKLGNSRKGLFNLKNEDNECFRSCHIRHLNPQMKDPQRIKKDDKKKVNELNYDGVEFPVSQRHYNKVETQSDIRIDVFGYENGQAFPIYISMEKFDNQMNLLLITNEDKEHYVLIKDFNRFMYNSSKHKESKHFCMYCLQCFSSEVILDKHIKNCLMINGAQSINMPNEGENILKFDNYHKQIPVPFVIYADFEAITRKVKGDKVKNNDQSYTEAYQKHEDCGYGYKVVCCYNDKYTKQTNFYRGENAV